MVFTLPKGKPPTGGLIEVFLKVSLPLVVSSKTGWETREKTQEPQSDVTLCFLEVTVLIYKMIGWLGFL